MTYIGWQLATLILTKIHTSPPTHCDVSADALRLLQGEFVDESSRSFLKHRGEKRKEMREKIDDEIKKNFNILAVFFFFLNSSPFSFSWGCLSNSVHPSAEEYAHA